MNPAELSGQQLIRLQAINPETVAHPVALLACALLTVGVPESVRFPFRDSTEEIAAAETRRTWQWCFDLRSADEVYTTADLIQWWEDPAWLEANPRHEWAILKKGLLNFAEVARRIRETVPRVIVRRGHTSAHIPANATPEQRERLLAVLEGRPVAAAA